MQSEQKVKVGLIKSAIKLSRAIKFAACSYQLEITKWSWAVRRGNESVNTFHYCMITREKIKPQNNGYKPDLTCLCFTSV